LSLWVVVGVIFGIEFVIRVTDYLHSRKSHSLGNHQKTEDYHKTVKAYREKVKTYREEAKPQKDLKTGSD